MNLQELPPSLLQVFTKYRVADADGNITQVNLKKAKNAEGRVLGVGPLIAEDVIQRFLAADTTPNKEWMDWMLWQAGGGKEAKRKSEQAIEQLKERFIDERVHGFRDGAGVHHEEVSEAEARQRWIQAEPRFREQLMVGDQDMEEKLHVFGFHRNWPGAHRIYEKVTMAVNRFLKLRKKAIAMNKFYEKEGAEDKVVSLDKADYDTVDALEATNKRVERFYASREARQDIRYEMIYEDDFLYALAPLTYAAAVEYGFNAWQWANKKTFDDRLEGASNSFNDPWQRTTSQDKKLFVYIGFKVAVPGWISYGSGAGGNSRFQRYGLDNLALVLPQDKLRNLNPDDVQLYDEENRNSLTLDDLKAMIRDEGVREYDRENEEYAIHRGPRVYKDAREAEEVVLHLESALKAIKQWAVTFNPKKVISDYMKGSE